MTTTASKAEREACKKFAMDRAGEVFDFNDSGQIMKGKVVGYYETFALLVMESKEKPLNEIDPIMGALSSNGIMLTKGSHYTFCFVSDIIDLKNEVKSTKYPHKCTKCGNPALILFRTCECSSYGCDNYKRNRG